MPSNTAQDEFFKALLANRVSLVPKSKGGKIEAYVISVEPDADTQD